MMALGAVAVVVSYLLGSIPFALLISKANGVDIRKVGSGNVGATNVFRMVGKGWGILTFVCDALKGFIPAWGLPRLTAMALGAVGPNQTLALLCGCAAVAGHTWPVFIGFKGGKGVATSAGMLLGVAPSAAGIGLAAWVLVLLVSGYVSLASILAAAIVPAAGWLLYREASHVLPIALTILGALVIWKHRTNVRRLLEGSEHRFRFGRSRAAPHDSSGGESAP